MKIERSDDGKFTLFGMSGQSMTVNQMELSQLVLGGKDYLDQLQQLESRGVKALSMIPVNDGTVSVDSHHTHLVLRLRHEGYEQAYSFSTEFAKWMIAGLTQQVALVESEGARRTRQ
jgi:hypothetical protein